MGEIDTRNPFRSPSDGFGETLQIMTGSVGAGSS